MLNLLANLFDRDDQNFKRLRQLQQHREKTNRAPTRIRSPALKESETLLRGRIDGQGGPRH